MPPDLVVFGAGSTPPGARTPWRTLVTYCRALGREPAGWAIVVSSHGEARALVDAGWGVWGSVPLLDVPIRERRR